MRTVRFLAVTFGPWLLVVHAADPTIGPRAEQAKIEIPKALDASGGYIRREGRSLFLTSDLRRNSKPGYWLSLDPDPRSPAVVCDSLPGAWDVAVAGDYAVVCDYTKSVTIYDLRDRQWRQAAQLKLPSMSENVIIRGKLAYIANHVAGLTIVDISDPSRPSIVSNTNPGIDCDAIGLWGDCAILYGHWRSRLVLVDISDPAKPRQTSTYENAPKTFNQGEMAVVDGLAYCTTVTGMAVVDVRDAAAPKLLSAVDLQAHVADVVVEDGYAFLAAGPKGIFVLDVSDPAAPVQVGRYRSPRTFAASQVAVLRIAGDSDGASIGGSRLIYAANSRGPAMVFIQKNRGATHPE